MLAHLLAWPTCYPTGVQLSVVTEKLNVVTDGGRRKLSVVTDGTAGKRSAWLHFCPYRLRIGSYI